MGTSAPSAFSQFKLALQDLKESLFGVNTDVNIKTECEVLNWIQLAQYMAH
jgi:hypothetical protein